MPPAWSIASAILKGLKVRGQNIACCRATLVVALLPADWCANRATTRVAPTCYMPTPAALKMSREAGRAK